MRHCFPVFLFFLFFGLQSSVLQAQSLKGYVYDSKTGEPIPFANVILLETKQGRVTDLDGFFAFDDLEEGSYAIEASFVGYSPQTKQVQPDNKTVLKFILQEDDQLLGEIELKGKRIDETKETTVSKINITPKKINRLPSIGGQSDLAQFIQTLPGVVFTGDQGGQLYIRGGLPSQTLVLLDGIIVYSPFHSIGFTSVFDTEIIKNADVYTAAFGAEYGLRNSSVIDIKTIDGNRSKLSGKLSVNSFGAGISLQGPLGKPVVDGFANSSFILSAKTSYLDKTSEILYPYALDEGEDNIPFVYNDIYAKTTFRSKTGAAKASVYGFLFTDEVNYNQFTNFDWRTSGVGANLKANIPNTLSVFDINFALSSYETNEINRARNLEGNLVDVDPKNSSINEFRLNFIVKNESSETISNMIGVNLGGGSTSFGYQRGNQISLGIEDNTTYFGAFYKWKYTGTLLVIEPSLRMSYYGELGELFPEPRIAAKYNVTENLRIKAAAGIYAQNLIAANNNRQVVNLFNAFISTAQDVPKRFFGEEITSGLQKARHAVLGAEYTVSENLTLNLEGYVKDFYQLININYDRVNPATASGSSFEEYELTDFNFERGVAQGVELSVNYSRPRFSFQANYSLNTVLFENERFSYHPFFDRRHNINAVASFELDKKETWLLDLRYNYGSGFPFAEVNGNFQGLQVTDVFSPFISLNGDLISDQGQIDGKRLPNFLRFDASITKVIPMKNDRKLDFNLTITNILDRDNIFYYDAVQEKRINQLPIFPSVGANFSF